VIFEYQVSTRCIEQDARVDDISSNWIKFKTGSKTRRGTLQCMRRCAEDRLKCDRVLVDHVWRFHARGIVARTGEALTFFAHAVFHDGVYSDLEYSFCGSDDDFARIAFVDSMLAKYDSL